MRYRTPAAVVLALSMAVNVLPGSPLQGTFAVFTDRASESGSITAGTWTTTLSAPADLECSVGRHWWSYFDAELRWDAVPGAQKYLVYYSRPFSGYFRLLGKVNAPNTDYDELRRSLLYHRYYVTAANSSGESDPSETIRVKCAPKRDFYHGPKDLKGGHHPHQADHDHFGAFAATSIGVGAGSTRDIELTWNRDGRSKKYAVLRSETPDGPYLERTTTTETQFVDIDLASPVSYYYIVVGVDEDGAESEPTNEIAVPGVALTVTPSPTPTASATASPTATAVPVKASPAPTVTQTATATPTPTTAPTGRSSGSGGSGGSGAPTLPPASSVSPTPTPTVTATSTAGPTPLSQQTPTPTSTAVPSATPTATPQPTASASPTASVTPVAPTPTAAPAVPTATPKG